MRIFQVDECVEVYVAHALATSGPGQTPSIGNFGLFELPLARLVRGFSQAIDAYVSARLLMLHLFWLNILLIVLATGRRLFSCQGILTLLGAATLAPLWDYGFEIRHDNPLLTGLLLIWCAGRVCPAGFKSFLTIGVLTGTLEFLAFKSFVYTIPISILLLAFPHPDHRSPRWKLTLAWFIGVIVALVAVRLVFEITGLWQAYLQGFSGTASASASGIRFGPGFAIGRLLTQTPLVLALAVAGLLFTAGQMLHARSGRIDWSSPAPEALLVLIALTALLINPTPFPYNLLHLVPFLFLLGVRYVAVTLEAVRYQKSIAMPVCGVILFTHFVPFWLSTSRHMDWPNWRQETVIRRAEDLTDPVKDPVYDATGLVFTRPIVDPRAFIHSSNIRNLLEGSGPRLHEMLAANPPAVLIPNYRTDALSETDHAFIRGSYVPISDDFWVLGSVLTNETTNFRVIHAGRYRISSLGASDISGTYADDIRTFLAPEEEGQISATLDGVELKNQVVELSVGPHRLETATGTRAAVVWVGPRRDRVHRLPNRDHRFLFVNWY